MADFIPHWILDGLAWDTTKQIAKSLLGAAIMTAAGQFLLTRVWHGLREKRERIAYWIGMPILLFTFLLFLTISNQGATPRLEGEFLEANISRSKDSGLAAVTLVANITNSGSAQSIAKDFKLSVETHESTYSGTLFVVPDDIQVFPEDDPNTTTTFYGDSALYNLATKPIPPGGIINGFLMFHFPSIDYRVFYNLPLTFRLSFEDAFSHKYSISKQTIGATKWQPQMYPGIHMKVETKK
jgi:hypothetical protein